MVFMGLAYACREIELDGFELELPASTCEEKSRMSLMTSNRASLDDFTRRDSALFLEWVSTGKHSDTHDAVNRSANFMAHVGQEFTLGAAGGLGSILGRAATLH